MSDRTRDEPSEEDLITFASRLLSDNGSTALNDPELLRETVREARGLWLKLYEASTGHA